MMLRTYREIMLRIPNTLTESSIIINNTWEVLLDADAVARVSSAGPWRRGTRCFRNSTYTTLWKFLHGDKVMIVPGLDYRSSNARDRTRVSIIDVRAKLPTTPQSGVRTTFHAPMRWKTRYETVTLPITCDDRRTRHVLVNTYLARFVPTEAKFVDGDFYFRAETGSIADGEDMTATVSLRSLIVREAGLPRAQVYYEPNGDYRVDPANLCFVAKKRSFIRFYKSSMGSIMHIAMQHEAHRAGRTWPTPAVPFVMPQRAIRWCDDDANSLKHVYILIDDAVKDVVASYNWVYNGRKSQVITLDTVDLPVSRGITTNTTNMLTLIAELNGVQCHNVTTAARYKHNYAIALKNVAELPQGTTRWRYYAKIVARYENQGFDEGSMYVSGSSVKYRVVRADKSIFVPDFYDGTGVICMDARFDSLYIPAFK